MISQILLLFIVITSILAKNKTMVIAGIVVFIFSLIDNKNIIKFTKDYFLNIGVTLLTIWILTPLIDNPNEKDILSIKNIFNIHGLVSLISGFIVVIIAAKGVNYLNNNPSALAGILLGSIIGTTFFDGIPVGILTGSGIAFLIIKIFKK